MSFRHPIPQYVRHVLVICELFQSGPTSHHHGGSKICLYSSINWKSSRANHSMFLPQHPIHSNVIQNHFWWLLNFSIRSKLIPCPWGSTYGYMGHQLTKVSVANHDVSFAWALLIHIMSKKSFWVIFWTFRIRSKTYHPWGPNICLYWH